MSKLYTTSADDNSKLVFDEIKDKDSKDFKFYFESEIYDSEKQKFVKPKDFYPPKYEYWAIDKDGSFYALTKNENHLCLMKTRTSMKVWEEIKKHLTEAYEKEIKGSFTQKVYTFKDLSEKRKYIVDRIKEIYEGITDEQINDVLDSVEITFRKQEEKAASNHETKKVFISYLEIEKYDIKSEKEFVDYLEHAKSPLTHEVMHIFQNLAKAFPNVKYVEKKDNGETEINYDKYINDPGEKQSRIEQIIELLSWGFGKDEIVQLLYSRKYKDKELWYDLVDTAIDAKTASSELPGDKEKDMLGRKLQENRGKKNRGTNYEQDYISSGTLEGYYDQSEI